MPDSWLSALPTFFKEKVFPPPNPHLSKTLKLGYFFIFTHLLIDEIGKVVRNLRI